MLEGGAVGAAIGGCHSWKVLLPEVRKREDRWFASVLLEFVVRRFRCSENSHGRAIAAPS